MKSINNYKTSVPINAQWLLEDLESRESFLLSRYKNDEEELLDHLFEEIMDNISMFLFECYDRVEERVAREDRNVDAENSNPHYRIEWKNENAFQENYRPIGVFKTLEDAVDEIQDKINTEFDLYRVIQVLDEKYKVIWKDSLAWELKENCEF